MVHILFFCLRLRCSITGIDLGLLLVDHRFVVRIGKEGCIMLTLASGVWCADSLRAIRIIDDDSGALL